MSDAVFYVPALHREAAGNAVPEDVAFFPSGLPESDSGGTGSAFALAAQSAVAKALPVAPHEARALLGDMLRMGEEYFPKGLLRQLGVTWMQEAQGRQVIGAGEAADIEAFAATGGLDEAGGVTVPDWGGGRPVSPAERTASVRDALVDCQKVLLLTHALEERVAEVLSLEKRFAEAESALSAALGESGGGNALFEEEDTEEEAVAADDSLAVPWRVVVDAVLPFLPERAVLFTADERMAHDLRESGMLQPFPEDRAAICAAWPHDLVSGLLFACLPAWRLVGRRDVPADRPWLDRDVEVVVARPAGGWLK